MQLERIRKYARISAAARGRRGARIVAAQVASRPHICAEDNLYKHGQNLPLDPFRTASAGGAAKWIS